MRPWRLKDVEKAMHNAETYAEWKEAANEHDRLSGMADWKQRQTTHLYDHHLIRSRLNRLTDLMNRNDDVALLYTLNEGIHGNLGGMGKLALYQQAKLGTKQLILDYIDAIITALQRLAATQHAEISFADKLDFFRRASHCFGRSALMLSGGATQGIFHIGVVRALYEQNLLPNVISGSSAGSVIAGVLATHSEEELKEYLSRESLRFEAMKFLGWSKIFKGVPLMDGEHLEKMLADYVPDLTFEEAYARSRRHVNITISPAKPQHESRMLNAITSPNVYIRKGISASCSVPGLFPPVTLTAKNLNGEPQPYNPTRQWIDGSLTNDLPTKRLSRIYGVNYYIASQINPHVLPFISEKGGNLSLGSMVGDIASKATKQALTNLLYYSRNRIGTASIGVMLTQVHALLAQDYSADIMIYPPDRKFSNPFKLFTDPSEKQVGQLIKEGEKATWPKIEMIRNCTRISRTLDSILETLEAEEHKRLCA